MKKTFIYICIFLVGAIFNPVEAQQKTDADNPVKAEHVTADPKSNPEEQALILQAGEDNPVKAEPVGTDKKKPGDTGHAKDQVINNKENNPKPESGKTETGENSQPAGHVPSRITNYREINGSNTQPEGEQPGKITNYRDMNGTNTQPEGKKPEKR